jgi:hypothetical protein
MKLPAAETAGYAKNDANILSFPDLIGESRENIRKWIVRSSRTMTGRQKSGNPTVPKALGVRF